MGSKDRLTHTSHPEVCRYETTVSIWEAQRDSQGETGFHLRQESEGPLGEGVEDDKGFAD